MSNRRLATVVPTALAALTLVTPPAHSYATFGHRLTYGVTGQQYWIDASALDRVKGINHANSAWNATSTPISYTRTYTKSVSRMDWYKSSAINAWWGLTEMYIDTRKVDPTSTNWWWAKVWLDGDFANCQNKWGVTTHEMGHGMGLAHVFGGQLRIMRADLASYMLDTPTADDTAGINALYSDHGDTNDGDTSTCSSSSCGSAYRSRVGVRVRQRGGISGQQQSAFWCARIGAITHRGAGDQPRDPEGAVPHRRGDGESNIGRCDRARSYLERDLGRRRVAGEDRLPRDGRPRLEGIHP